MLRVCAPDLLRLFSGAKNAKQFLLRMKEVHTVITRSIPDAHLPVFSFEDPAPNKLVMKYASQRGLEDVFVGLVKSAGRHFKENLQIRRVKSDVVEITFRGLMKRVTGPAGGWSRPLKWPHLPWVSPLIYTKYLNYNA